MPFVAWDIHSQMVSRGAVVYGHRLVALGEEPSALPVPDGSSASAACSPMRPWAALACELCGDTTGPFQNPLNRVYCADFDGCDVRRGVRAA